MEGYEVITSDEQKAGRVVDLKGDYVVVEYGLLRKKRRAIPKPFLHADDSEHVVRLSVAWDMVDTSPKIDNGSVDERAGAAHYGLVEGYDAPETKGYGELLPGDPAWSAEEEELRTGVEPAAEQRARIRTGKEDPGPHGRPIIPPDPHEGP